MVEDSVIAHVLLYFQNIFDLFEVVGDFRRHLVEMLLRVEQQILCEFVSFANLFDVPRELSNELLDFPLPFGFDGILSGSWASHCRGVPSHLDDIVTLAGEHD
jgi:hypothetical protein